MARELVRLVRVLGPIAESFPKAGMQVLGQILRQGERICSSADYLEADVYRLATAAQLPSPRWQNWWVPRVAMLLGGHRQKLRRRMHQLSNMLRRYLKDTPLVG